LVEREGLNARVPVARRDEAAVLRRVVLDCTMGGAETVEGDLRRSTSTVGTRQGEARGSAASAHAVQEAVQRVLRETIDAPLRKAEV